MDKRQYKAYRCFSERQKRYLMGKGFEYICIAKDPNTDSLFWLFLRHEDFNKALDEWDKVKYSFN